MADRRQTRQLTEEERRRAEWLLADGCSPDDVARRLGTNVRSLNGLRDTHLCRDLDPAELRKLNLRNALVLYWRSRERLERLAAAMPDDADPDQHSAFFGALSSLDARARDNLRLVHDSIEALGKAGGGDVTAGRIVEIPVPGEPDPGDLVSDGDGDGEDTDDDADQ